MTNIPITLDMSAGDANNDYEYYPFHNYGHGSYYPRSHYKHHRHHRHPQYDPEPLFSLLNCAMPLTILDAASGRPLVSPNHEMHLPADATSHVGKNGFQVSMDATVFKPSELKVKVVNDCIIVEGQHAEREDDHGFVTRHFVRRYKLPLGYDPDKVASTLSSDGILTISVPKPLPKEEKSNERLIHIQQTGPAFLHIKRNEPDQTPAKQLN